MMLRSSDNTDQNNEEYHDATGLETPSRSQLPRMLIMTQVEFGERVAEATRAQFNELSDPIMGLVSATSLEILQHLRTRYGIFLASDFGSFRRSLEETIGSRTFAEVAAAHRLIHVQFGTANQHLSKIDKCRCGLEGI